MSLTNKLKDHFLIHLFRTGWARKKFSDVSLLTKFNFLSSFFFYAFQNAYSTSWKWSTPPSMSSALLKSQNMLLIPFTAEVEFKRESGGRGPYWWWTGPVPALAPGSLPWWPGPGSGEWFSFRNLSVQNLKSIPVSATVPTTKETCILVATNNDFRTIPPPSLG